MYVSRNIKLVVITSSAEAGNATVDALRNIGITVAGVAITYQQALNTLLAVEYDMVLLQLPASDGLHLTQLVRFIHGECNKPFVVQSLESDDLVKQGIALGACGTITIPGDLQMLSFTLHNAIKGFQSVNALKPMAVQGQYIFVKLGEKFKRVDWKDIVYLRSDNRYTCLFNSIDEREYPIRATLIKTMQDVIPAALRNNFIQVNRAEAVNVPYINEFYGHELKTSYKTMYLSEGGSKELKARVLCLA